jgi:hypothetical protein
MLYLEITAPYRDYVQLRLIMPERSHVVGVVPFFVGLISSAVIVLILAVSLGITIAFLLPTRFTKAAYALVEWSTALSAAAPLAFILLLPNNPIASLSYHGWRPFALGVVIALSYLPLGIILLLRVVEPRWPVLLACRSLGLRSGRTTAVFVRSTGTDFTDVLGIFLARLLADGAAVMLILYKLPALATVIILTVTAMVLYRYSLYRLTHSMGVPAYPPLFGALPELPSGMHIPPRLNRLAQNILKGALVVLIVLAAVEFLGLSALPIIDSAYANRLMGVITPMTSRLTVTLQSMTLLVLAVGCCIWLWKRANLVWLHHNVVSLAVLSPILFALPGTLLWPNNVFAGWMLYASGAFIYVVIQYSAARAMQAVVVQRTLVPGEMATAAAMRSLGLSLTAAHAHGPGTREILSAAAIWCSSAAVAGILLGITTTQTATNVVLWGGLAGVLQGTAMQMSRIRPCAIPSTIPLSATLEALSHDTT